VKRRKLIHNTNIPKHASCLQQGTKVILQKHFENQLHFCPEYKVLCLWQIQYNTLMITTLHIFKAASCYCMGILVILKDGGVFQDKKETEWS
jgi:hypothetical protein